MKIQLTALMLASLLAVGAIASPKSDEAAIRHMYDDYVKAYETKDVSPVMRMVTDDFKAKMDDGKVLDRAHYKDIMAKQLSFTEKEEFHWKFKEGAPLTTRSATVITDETIVTKSMGVELKSVTEGQDNWVRTPAGWRIKSTDSLSEKYYANGTPVDMHNLPPSPSASP